jgi:hypothetical protein
LAGLTVGGIGPKLARNGAVTMLDKENLNDSIKLTQTILPILGGHKTEVISYTLAQLLARLLVTYHPDSREGMLARHVLQVGRMLPAMDKEVFSNHRRPQDWPPAAELGPKRSDYP